MINYAKLGEYTAFKRQAQDAAGRRHLALAMLVRKATEFRDANSTAIEPEELTDLLQEAVKAEKEMRAAMDVANQAAPLCDEHELDLLFLMKV